MHYPIAYANPYDYRSSVDQDERFFPVIPFLAGLAVAPILYNALHPGGYYAYPPPPPPYYPYGYYPGYNPYYHGYY